MPDQKLVVKPSLIHGQGVYALIPIAAGSLIEACPVIILNPKDTAIIDQTHLYNYYFTWEAEHSAIALGYGSIYNHSYQPNARYQTDYSNKVIHITALIDIPAGVEIMVNYNGEPRSQVPVWFEKKQG